MPGFRSNNNTDCVYASNFDFSGSSQPSNTMTLDGQLLIGSTALNAGTTHCNIGYITSPLGTLSIAYSYPNITMDLVGGFRAIEVISGDTGSVSGNSITIYANNATNNAGQSVKFVNSGTISTLNLTDNVYNTMLGLNSGNISVGYTHMTAVGAYAGMSLSSGGAGTYIGFGAGQNSTTGSNTFVGAYAGQNVNVVSGGNNIALGYDAYSNIGPYTGSNNIVIGVSSAGAFTSSESSNIIIGGAGCGVVGDNNTIRIGVQGSTTGKQNAFYTVSPFYVTDTSYGNVAYSFTTANTTGWGNANNATIYGYSGGSNVVQFGYENIFIPGNQNQFQKGMTFQITSESSNYNVASTDYAIFFDTVGGSYTATLPNSALTNGQTYIIKDSTGHAAANNLTISGNGNNIDGAATFVINTNFGSATLIFNSSTWSVV